MRIEFVTKTGVSVADIGLNLIMRLYTHITILRTYIYCITHVRNLRNYTHNAGCCTYRIHTIRTACIVT